MLPGRRGKNWTNVPLASFQVIFNADHVLFILVKDKYGSDPETDGTEEDSEDGESEDEDGQELTPAVDAAILRTLAKIKRKDPEIYDKDKSIFERMLSQILCTSRGPTVLRGAEAD